MKILFYKFLIDICKNFFSHPSSLLLHYFHCGKDTEKKRERHSWLKWWKHKIDDFATFPMMDDTITRYSREKEKKRWNKNGLLVNTTRWVHICLSAALDIIIFLKRNWEREKNGRVRYDIACELPHIQKKTQREEEKEDKKGIKDIERIWLLITHLYSHHLWFEIFLFN